LTCLFITHDLSVIAHISNRVGIMYLGKIVELASVHKLLETPLHPYSEALLSAIPRPDPEIQSSRIILKGDVSSPINVPSGCAFHPRCRYAEEICSQRVPHLKELESDHFVSCHLTEKLDLQGVEYSDLYQKLGLG